MNIVSEYRSESKIGRFNSLHSRFDFTEIPQVYNYVLYVYLCWNVTNLKLVQQAATANRIYLYLCVA